jgi:hypothetical protein
MTHAPDTHSTRTNACTNAPRPQAILYRGPRDVAGHVLKNEGGVPGLFKGLGATLTREVGRAVGRLQSVAVGCSRLQSVGW